MAAKMGRPKKASTEEKIAIVNGYYYSREDDSVTKDSIHGLYKKLSDYAKSLGCELEPHDFSRDADVRRAINTLVAGSEEPAQAFLPTYEPLDITTLWLRSRQERDEILRGREAYFAKLHKRASKAIENNVMLTEKNNILQEKLSAISSEKDALEEEVKSLRLQLRKAATETAYLKKVIRKEVEPERAHHVWQNLSTEAAIEQAAKPAVMNSLTSLGQADQKLQVEAAAEVDMLDLRKLFI